MSQGDWQAGMFNSENYPDGYNKCNISHGHWRNVDAEDCDNINYLELIPVWLVLIWFADVWKDNHVLCFTDNTKVVAILRSGHSHNKHCMELLRSIFWICAKNNIYMTTSHIAGSLNIGPDMLSHIGSSYELSDLVQYSVCCSDHLRVG